LTENRLEAYQRKKELAEMNGGQGPRRLAQRVALRGHLYDVSDACLIASAEHANGGGFPKGHHPLLLNYTHYTDSHTYTHTVPHAHTHKHTHTVRAAFHWHPKPTARQRRCVGRALHQSTRGRQSLTRKIGDCCLARLRACMRVRMYKSAAVVETS
jgi:hypothetical protein